MSESELYAGGEPVVETEDGFESSPSSSEDRSAIDSAIDFDDEEYDEAELIDEKTAGNAEGGGDAHLDDPAKVADDQTF